jgi:hypothetical protein
VVIADRMRSNDDVQAVMGGKGEPGARYEIRMTGAGSESNTSRRSGRRAVMSKWWRGAGVLIE